MRPPFPIHRHNTRRLYGLLACLVWLLGVEVAPSLHLALHRWQGHHHHSAQETAQCVQKSHKLALNPQGKGTSSRHHGHGRRHGHRHDPDYGHAHHHAHPQGHNHGQHAPQAATPLLPSTSPDDPNNSTLGVDRTDAFKTPGPVPHGAGSLAHRELLWSTPPAALPPVPNAPWQAAAYVETIFAKVHRRTPQTKRARGPPIPA